MSEQAETAPEPKKARRMGYVLVSIANWPPQDPGRLLLFTVRPTIKKALRQTKRLAKRLPEYTWSAKELSHREALAIERAPFYVDSGLGDKLEVLWTGRSFKVRRI